MSHTGQIATHLRRHKSITPHQAYKNYGCFRLAAVIYRLRGRGWVIDDARRDQQAHSIYVLKKAPQKKGR